MDFLISFILRLYPDTRYIEELRWLSVVPETGRLSETMLSICFAVITGAER